MSDGESEFKYYKLGSCYIAFIVLLFFIEKFRLTMISDLYCTNSLLLHSKIPPSFAASNSTYLFSHQLSESGPSRCGFAGSAWLSLGFSGNAVRLLAGVAIAEWLSGTRASVPSSHGTAGGRSHFPATMWTLLHRATGLLPAWCSLPPQARGEKKSKKNHDQHNLL